MTWTLVGADGRRYSSPLAGTLGGHRRGGIYGRLDCPSALRAIARGGYVDERVFFADERTAAAAGLPAVCGLHARRVRSLARGDQAAGRVASPACCSVRARAMPILVGA